MRRRSGGANRERNCPLMVSLGSGIRHDPNCAAIHTPSAHLALISGSCTGGSKSSGSVHEIQSASRTLQAAADPHWERLAALCSLSAVQPSIVGAKFPWRAARRLPARSSALAAVVSSLSYGYACRGATWVRSGAALNDPQNFGSSALLLRAAIRHSRRRFGRRFVVHGGRIPRSMRQSLGTLPLPLSKDCPSMTD